MQSIGKTPVHNKRKLDSRKSPSRCQETVLPAGAAGLGSRVIAKGEYAARLGGDLEVWMETPNHIVTLLCRVSGADCGAVQIAEGWMNDA
jgi:hypothetical protein